MYWNLSACMTVLGHACTVGVACMYGRRGMAYLFRGNGMHVRWERHNADKKGHDVQCVGLLFLME